MSKSNLSLKAMPSWFQEVLTKYRRFKTKPVSVGKIVIGDGNPIWIQSMTNTDTMDTTATVDQIKRLSDVGCDIARVTVPNLNAARNLEPIKNKLITAKYDIPIVADVHFTPQAAIVAAEIVEKVRINPGNFVDRKHFEEKEYTDTQYSQELKRVEEKLIPLIEICKKNHVALRIGSNHGSLSDRIFNRYGDGPAGMVESALEFLDICERENFDQVIFSMKSSNTLVMVAAYRFLLHRLWERGNLYPLHLGVTEAGDDEDGRSKSSLGIGSLLMDGIGDTIRVSLTEDPEKEIPVAKKIVTTIQRLTSQAEDPNQHLPQRKELVSLNISELFDPFVFNKTETTTVDTWGGNNPIRLMFAPGFSFKSEIDLLKIGISKAEGIKKWHRSFQCPDLLLYRGKVEDLPLYQTLLEAGQQVLLSAKQNSNELPYNLIYDSFSEFKDRSLSSLNNSTNQNSFSAVRVCLSDYSAVIDLFKKRPEVFSNLLLILEAYPSCQGETEQINHSLRSLRYLILSLKAEGIHCPLVLSMNGLVFSSEVNDQEECRVAQAIYAGYLLVDGIIDGLSFENGQPEDLQYMFSVLQASRQRISKPEYISCPSCGRTLFDLQEVTAKVKAATHHLVGVKIAVMGCIVNGPGEMADADFGYVGSGPGKITLYKGKKVMIRNVNSENAVQELVSLIKREGYWREPELQETAKVI